MKINLICMGDIKEKYLRDAIGEYSKRISRFAELKIIELKEHVAPSNSLTDINKALVKDAEDIKKYLKGHIICLDINGKMLKSEDFSKRIEKISLTSGEISFVIGASNGIHESIKNLAHEKMSFSLMTFPHQLMRVIFLEQLYRAFTILNNIAYHK
ncbi:MAG: 23S rRNA (pseudouridine(1915)-N(3))-methyltransferase RlmH [Clostridia bacterium]|nr:23S rRNA (pseudouridine(1915)-N(3))-methyltransferase RlmH [Clostridia bacterium]